MDVYKKYNRLTSRLMIRRILIPTRANLDYSAYDSNVMYYNPSAFRHKTLDEKALSDLHFQGTLVPESLADQISSTPLTPEEIASLMAWIPMTEYLIDRDFDQGYPLAKAGWKISEDSWGDDNITESFQEISRVYIHKGADGKHELWVKIEFKPWVKFLKDIDDEDKDGFPEIYGKLDSKRYNESVISGLLDDYTKTVLFADEVTDWGYRLASDNYDKYATVALKPEQIADLPNDQTKAELKKELDSLMSGNSIIVIRGRPFGEIVLNVFLIPK